jgi:PAS domain S-box-containing protein/putative nucleotidyltransferase with HDIG domain
VELLFIVKGVESEMRQELTDGQYKESAFTNAKNGDGAVKDGNGQLLSGDSIKKYIDLLEDLNGGRRTPAIAVDEPVFLDNTQKMLRKADEKIRRIFDNSFDGIAVLDLDGNVVEANRTILDIAGLQSDVEIIGRNYIDFITPLDRKRIKTQVQKVFSVERITNLECTLIRKDGTEVCIEINAVQLNDIYNDPFGILLSMKNVSRHKQAEEANRLYNEKMLQVMGEIIEAMARMVEIRDPYTAGHQRRVSVLAAAIAREMELPNETVEGVRVAGMVHDIGKIYIPAEILSKPTELNEMEYRMIEQHPRLSYDILNAIEFPWPVATIVYQHHERIDGSGYPEKLSGEDITIEARILAVADVVEAMASRRPYRAALGVDRAIEEISKKRGILYDSAVVDACKKTLIGENALKYFNE